jgi:hypothetical protein
MGNCLKKSKESLITDKYLFEPLNTQEDIYFDETEISTNQTIDNCVGKIEDLQLKFTNIETKLNLLEKNTRDNFESISGDIYYIHEKNNQTEYASFINEKQP